jgi:hypothetical protein
MKSLTLYLLLALSFVSCGTSQITFSETKDKNFSAIKEPGYWKGSIPPGFEGSDFTLLVIQTGTKSWDKHLESNFSELYTGKYKIISEMEFSSETYRDLNLYPFSFSASTMLSGTGSRDRATGMLWPYILDRKANKEYAYQGTGNGYSPMMKAYIKKMEKARKDKE